MKKNRSFLWFIPVPLISLLLLILPPVRARLEWGATELSAQIKYYLFPPEAVVFQPKQQISLLPTATPFLASPTASASKTLLIPIPSPSMAAQEATALPATATPLPQTVTLSGARYERQGWNNCGPATLAMALSFWGWQGDQYKIMPFTKPNLRDKNVMPYEITDFVNSTEGYHAVSRFAGDQVLLKRFISAGFPVMVEKGFEGNNFDGWMGHYELITGYDDTTHRFTAQDSYLGPDLPLPYAVLEANWRAFNGTYMIVYPSNRESEVLDLLGSQKEESDNRAYASQKATGEAAQLTGRDQFFSLFNEGTSLVALLDYPKAAAAYDQAFAMYASLPEKERPWRMMWYQTGPYWAYYYTGRYQDVIDLATKTLDNMSEPILEESYYWRGRAYEATGDREKAIRDYRKSIQVHPGFGPALDQLNLLGIEIKRP